MFDAHHELDALLDQVRAQVRTQPADHPAGPDTGAGEAAGGLVQARMGPDGRLTALVLDERTAGMSRAELQRDIMAAVNQAWATSQGAAAQDAAVANLDPAAVTEQLAQVQEQSVRSMRRITDGLADAMRQIERSTRR